MADKKKLTRSDATELYKDLQKAMKHMQGEPAKKTKKESAAKQIAQAIRESLAKDKDLHVRTDETERFESQERSGGMSIGALLPKRRMPSGVLGQSTAFMIVLVFALMKISFSLFEASGIFQVEDARASLAPQMTARPFQGPNYSPEEVRILRALDARRVELEERRKQLDDREVKFHQRDQEYAARLTEVRELTEKLKLAREKNDKKRNNQLEQLANVYGSMGPKEAATLMEQLDVTIALSLLERMPEKRIGQILSLMSPEKALTITRMLSGKRG